MIKSQDILVMMRLWDAPQPNWSLSALGADLGMAASTVHRALDRLGRAGLYDRRKGSLRHAQALEFLVYAARYLFPAEYGGEVRGITTAWSAAPLRDLLAPRDDLPVVWAHPEGSVRGVALEPVHPNAPDVARRSPGLGELLAMVDALRAGDARVRELAGAELRSRVGAPRVVSA